MIEEFKPGIPKKPFASEPAKASEKPDMSYVEMALGQEPGYLGESNDQIAQLLVGVKNFPDLRTALDGIKGVQGSKIFYSSANLIQHISNYIKSGRDPLMITNGAGLRDKVQNLIQTGESRFATFTAAIRTLDSEFSLPSFKPHALAQFAKRSNQDNHESLAIYRGGAFFGRVTSPAPGSFNSVNEFKEEVRKLLESRNK